MIQHFIQWGHLYIVHFGALMSFCLAANVTKSGLPPISAIPQLVYSSAALSAIIAIFSSGSHAHYIAAITTAIK
jgi:hypothetical protein